MSDAPNDPHYFDPMVSQKKFANWMDVSRKTLWRWEREFSDFPAKVLFGTTVRYSQREVEEFIRRHRGNGLR